MKIRLLVTGDREWTNRRTIRRVLKRFPEGTILIHGAARGADTIAGEIGKQLGFKVVPYPANWNKFHRAAGPIRNKQMLDEGKPTEAVAFHPNLEESKGTADMVKRLEKAGIPVRVYAK